ncbi:MAG TPA: GEVED domain-containing protein [Nevskiaceae bacterium]|nr:GEVED domain-containing protein [Nevskiaceae bacterium]
MFALGYGGQSGAVVCATPPNGMTAWWQGENNGTDIIGGNTLTTTGVTFVTGEVNKAFSFDGSHEAIVADPADGSLDQANSEITIDAWLNVDNTGGTVTGTIVQKIDTSSLNLGYQFFLSNGTLYALINLPLGQQVQVGKTYPTDHAWHHVAALFSTLNTHPTVWIDGVAQVGPALYNGDISNVGPFEIGMGTNGNLTGLVDEVEVFSGVELSTSDIQSIYNAGTAGKCVPAQSLDFGDAPAPYPTLLADDGARHVVATPLLGSSVDSEADGQPDADALGDDNGGTDDEDGVVFSTLTTGAGATLTATVAGGSGKVDAWIDFDQDGAWSVSEKILSGADVSVGSNPLNFNVPAAAKGGATFARVRVSSAGVTDPTGSAPDGEVEDYKVSIDDLSPNPFSFPPKLNVPLNTFITSAKVTPTGYADGSPITVNGGTYSIGCTATFTNAPGTISPGQSVCVRVKSAATRSTATFVTLTIGGVSGSFVVTTIPPPPFVQLSASPLTVHSGGSTTLTWNSLNAVTCSGAYGTSSWAKPKPTAGSTSSGPINGVNGSKPFRITCKNPGGTASADVKITVLSP